MTARHDPDRIVQAWLDLMPDEAPDRAIDAVLQAVERTPQSRGALDAARRRTPVMSRFWFLASAATIVVLVAAAAIGMRPTSSASVHTPGPSTAVPASAGPPSASPIAATGDSLPAGVLLSQWIADIGAIPGIGAHDRYVRLLLASDELQLQTTASGEIAFHSVATGGGTDELRLVTDRAGAGCGLGEEGLYRWALSSDGSSLSLTAVSDTCTARATALGRTWVQGLDVDNLGGRGVLVAFDPAIMVTLPLGGYGAEAQPDVVEIDSTYSRFVAIRDPWGLMHPCASAALQKRPIVGGSAAIATYLRTLPGVSVRTSASTVDGLPAVHLAITSKATAGCPNDLLAAFIPRASADQTVSLVIGATESFYAVDVAGATYVLGFTGPAVTQADERAVLGSVQFISALPTQP